MTVDYEKMSYRELQAACKAMGLSAKGSTDELLTRLKAAGTTAEPEQAEAVSDGTAEDASNDNSKHTVTKLPTLRGFYVIVRNPEKDIVVKVRSDTHHEMVKEYDRLYKKYLGE